MEVLDATVSTEDLENLDSDCRPLWPESGMTCPVENCPSGNHFQRYTNFSANWKKQHEPWVDVWRCPMCTCKDLRKNFVYRHLMKVHKLSPEKASEEAAPLNPFRERNLHFVEPGCVCLPAPRISTERKAARESASMERKALVGSAVTLERQEFIPRDETIDITIDSSGETCATRRLKRTRTTEGTPYVAPDDF